MLVVKFQAVFLEAELSFIICKGYSITVRDGLQPGCLADRLLTGHK